MCKEATKRAVEAARVALGSHEAVAAELGISRQAIGQWEQTPPKHVLKLEALSGVSRHELRPDIYGPAPAMSKPETEEAA